MKSLLQARLEADADTHVHVAVVTNEKVPVDLDISNDHGRRVLSVRSDGMVIGSLLLDVAEAAPVSRRIERFCPYCGEKREMVSSKDSHVC